MNDVVFVALGAVPGAWLRFRIVNHLQPLLPRRHWGTFAVNVVACFIIGLITPLVAVCGAGLRIHLLLATGFLGSLSTFSSFILEVLQPFLAGEFRQSLMLLCGSILAGLMAVFAGVAISG
jgi:CrcB protein